MILRTYPKKYLEIGDMVILTIYRLVLSFQCPFNISNAVKQHS